MVYFVCLLLAGAVLLVWCKKRPTGLKRAVAKKRGEDAPTVAYVSPFADEPTHYLSHSDAARLLEKVHALNSQLSPRDTNRRFYKEVADRNKQFIGLEKERCRQLFADVDGRQLDQQQQTSVLVDEDATLVIAGAGAGKTTTLAGKVLYLTRECGVDPNDILLLVFTNKAADEMTERIRDRMGIPIVASTFHKLGLEIIKSTSDTPVSVFDDTTGFIRNYFDQAISNDEMSPLACQDLLEFFSYYLRSPADMEEHSSLGSAIEAEMNADFETLKSKMDRATFISTVTEEKRAEGKVTIKGEVVKSLAEVAIANFLYLHGISYIYEFPYKYQVTDGKHTAYKPDFYLPDYDIWIEHFGTDRYGTTPWLSPVEAAKYQEGMIWKRELHKKNRTTLLETYSWYVSDGILLSRL